jgi:hypothetical protein
VVKAAQLGIALGLLGIVITLVGAFPGVVAITPTPGFGIGQILLVLVGFTLLVLGAMIYVKFAFYAFQALTLLQQVGTRLAYTGLTFAALVALADVLGFGSNLRARGEDVLFGPLQLTGIMIWFGIAALGVVIFAVGGEPEISEE